MRFAIIAALLAVATPAQATLLTWDLDEGLWDSPNWLGGTPGQIPGLDDDVIIERGTVLIAADASAASVRTGRAVATLRVVSGTTRIGTISGLPQIIVESGQLVAHRFTQTDDYARLDVAAGAFVRIDDFSTLTDTTIKNYGTIDIGTMSIVMASLIQNYGLMIADSVSFGGQLCSRFDCNIAVEGSPILIRAPEPSTALLVLATLPILGLVRAARSAAR